MSFFSGIVYSTHASIHHSSGAPAAAASATAAAAAALPPASGAAAAAAPPPCCAVSRRCSRMPVATLTFKLSTRVWRPGLSSICRAEKREGRCGGGAGVGGSRGGTCAQCGYPSSLLLSLLPACTAVQTPPCSTEQPPAAWRRRGGALSPEGRNLRCPSPEWRAAAVQKRRRAALPAPQPRPAPASRAPWRLPASGAGSCESDGGIKVVCAGSGGTGSNAVHRAPAYALWQAKPRKPPPVKPTSPKIVPL